MIIENEKDQLVITYNPDMAINMVVSSKGKLENLAAIISDDVRKRVISGESVAVVELFEEDESLRVDGIIFNKDKKTISFLHGGNHVGGGTGFKLSDQEWDKFIDFIS